MNTKGDVRAMTPMKEPPIIPNAALFLVEVELGGNGGRVVASMTEKVITPSRARLSS